ncbi:hypothetical protein QE152_g25068 [Popillia japonica]|uniref:Uncharacterized protein n=1 Tax=Popillia japonica TaxID=7064 RepID=A0AAW1K424_POPJA
MKFSAVLFTFLAVLVVVLSRPQDCNPDRCNRIRCYYVDREACDPDSEVFVPRDGKCYCCDTCIAIERLDSDMILPLQHQT